MLKLLLIYCRSWVDLEHFCIEAVNTLRQYDLFNLLDCYPHDISAVEFVDRSVSKRKDQTLTCSLSGISQDSPITWINPDNVEISDSDTDNYVIDQGTFVFGRKASTLTIKQQVLQSLPETSVYKCKVKSSAYPEFSVESVNEMTLTLLELGQFKCQF